VAGRQRDGLVEEEQLGVRARAHHRTPAPAKAGETRDSAPSLRVAHDAPIGLVQTAAIAHQQPARLGGDEIAERRDPILERHRCVHDIIADAPERMGSAGRRSLALADPC